MFKPVLISQSGFTLIEILVVVAIMMIMLVGIGNVNFTRLSVKQEQEIFVNSFITNIETIRNFGFQGKSAGTSLTTPDSWLINISSAGDGSFTSSYEIGGTSTAYNQYSLTLENGYFIESIECRDISGNALNTADIELRIVRDKMNLSGCGDDTYKIARVILSHRNFSDTVEINTINNVIQKL